jgi:hypothetical protein
LILQPRDHFAHLLYPRKRTSDPMQFARRAYRLDRTIRPALEIAQPSEQLP